MRNYRDKRVENEFLALGFTRTHPWIDAVADSSHKYYDFIKNPELIERSLEDFLPYGDAPAVVKFYDLLRWLNGPDSVFESNDSALSDKLEINTDRNDAEIAGKRYRMRGRLIFFFRDHILNADKRGAQWLWNDLPQELLKVDPRFTLGIVGYSKVLAAYLSLPEPLNELSYQSVCLKFFVWGDDQDETLNNLQRTFTGTLAVLQKLSAKAVEKGLPDRGRTLMKKISENDSETILKFTTPRPFD